MTDPQITPPGDELTRAHEELAQAKVELAHVSEELACAREGLEAFVRSASHDLKAPIRHIFGFCGFVRDGAADRLTDEEKKDLDRVMNAASHMSKLLKSLSRFAKLGLTTPSREVFSLREVVEMLVAQLPLEQQSHVHHSRLTEITGDRMLLTLVLQNLMENGLKYVQDRTPEVIIESVSSPTETRVWVTDNGIGVESVNRKRIFEAGVRGVSDSEFSGTGFGLATSARIVKAHQGKIWVEPNAGQGSTFFFEIPHDPHSSDGPIPST